MPIFTVATQNMVFLNFTSFQTAVCCSEDHIHFSYKDGGSVFIGKFVTSGPVDTVLGASSCARTERCVNTSGGIH